MPDNDEFFSMTASEGIEFVKHNPADYASFKDFQRSMNERFSELEKERDKKAITSNLKKWEDSLPGKWKTASLPTIKTEAAEKVAKIITKNGFSSFFLEGDAGSGKTYLAYAILRRYIGMNFTSSSKIECISEEALMGLAATGFEGMGRFNKILNPKFNIFLIDGIGSHKHYSEKERQLWEQLLDHIYSNDLKVIFTSLKKPADFGIKLSDSGDRKLHSLIADGRIYLKTQNSSGEESTDEFGAGSKDLDIFNSFDGK